MNIVLNSQKYNSKVNQYCHQMDCNENRKAYEKTLSIILDEPDIKMEEVKVVQVILNRYGKRAIRLDAWRKTVDNRQINMEMENNMHDDVKK